MENILVSIIIPTYQRPALVEKAVESVLNQTHKNIEIIIVDDNHPESVFRKSTELLFSNYPDERVHYYKHRNNEGANTARNTGFKYSSGDYIAFLDDDDEYYVNKIEIQLTVAEQNKSRKGVLVFVGAEIIKNEVSRFSFWILKKEGTIYFADREVLFSNFIGSNSFVLIDRSSFEKVGGYDETLPSCQDWDLWIRLAKTGVNLIGVAKPLVKYYERAEISRITNDASKKVRGHLEILKKHKDYLYTKDSETIKCFYRYLYYQILPIDKETAFKILKIQFKKENGKNLTLLFIDFSMFFFVRFPKLYEFFREVKHKQWF